MGTDAPGFNATLYRGDKKIATLIESGGGGCIDYTWLDYKVPRVEIKITDSKGKPHTFSGTPEEKILCEFIETLPLDPPSDIFPEGMKADIDTFVSRLVDGYETEKQLRRWCNTKTVFQLTTNKEGEYKTINRRYNESVKQYIQKKYGDKLKEIVNERFLK